MLKLNSLANNLRSGQTLAGVMRRARMVRLALMLAALSALFVLGGGAVGVRAEGGLDTSFGVGKVSTDFGEQEFGQGVAIQADGKIVVVGHIHFSTSLQAIDFLVARYKADGSLDTSFGNNGKVITDFFGSVDEAYAVAIQPDGKIVVAGFATEHFPESDFALARYDSNGTLDRSFGTNGKQTTDFFHDADKAFALTIRGDGGIIAAGQDDEPGNGARNFALALYSPQGILDTTFGVGGKVRTDFQGFDDKANSVVSLPDGKILLAGEMSVSIGDRNFALARYKRNGDRDESFGDVGKVITDFGGTGDTAAAAAIQPDGKIVAVGQVSSDFGLARYNTGGALDFSFDGDGKAVTNFFSFDEAKDLAFQADGKILVAGVIQTPSGGRDFALARYTTGGALDTTFGTLCTPLCSGVITTDFAGLLDTIGSMKVQPDGKVLLAGTTQSGGTTSNDFGLARYVTTLPAATRIQFSQASYSAAETANDPMAEPVVLINVTRSGDLSGASKVDYQPFDDPSPVPCDPTASGGPYPQGTAYARCDYATTIDTLSFAPGESQKSFRVPLVNDSHAEVPETFTVVLSNPQGAALDARYGAVVTINDDDTGAGPNPINNHQFFVRQQYLDFLSREPEAGGFNAWVATLNNCADPFNFEPNVPSASCDRISVSKNFLLSDEFHLKGLYVYKFYKVVLPPGSLPTYAEISRDMRSVTGQTPEEVHAKKAAYANAFVQRYVFRAAYDDLSNGAYVSALLTPYNLTAITTKDPAAPDGIAQVTLTQADLTARLDAMTLTRAQVLRAVVDSTEVNTAEFNGAFGAMQDYGYLRRTPEPGGYNDWLTHLNSHPGDYRSLVRGFLYSLEYSLRFGPTSGSNLAAGQTATQSSEGWGGTAALANDGNADGYYWDGSVTHTQYESQPWWQVDLGVTRTISSIQLWNRSDCCTERLSNFYVFVSDAPFTSTDVQTTLNQPGVSGYYTAGEGGAPSTIVVNRTGRYVRVQLAGSSYLSLAEVKVWGR
jgi:uncharacterized delta-60 repeat protein